MRSHPSEAMAVFRLIYRSHNLIPADRRKVELGRLFTHARSANKSKDITGALQLSGDAFVQTLEGDETLVRALYEHIAADPRHDQVALLDTTDDVEPAFPRWSMAEVAPSDGEPDTYLIAHQDGISPATSRGSSPEQEAVLQTMRAAARSAQPA